MPLCYAYNPVTGEFVGSLEADPSPLEPDVFLYPAFTTTDPPPDPAAGQAACWSGAAWIGVADHRGETWYAADGTSVTIGQLGDPLSDGYSQDAPPPAEPQVPPVVSRFQGRRALKDAGLFATVEAMIAASGDDFLQDAWADASEFRRDSPFIHALGMELGLTEAQIDDLFRAAALIVA